MKSIQLAQYLAALAAAVVATGQLAWAETPTMGSPSTDSTSSLDQASGDLSTLDNSFRKSYAETKKQIQDSLGPVVVVTGDLTLLKGGKRITASFIPQEYTVTKTVDHIPLDIFVILTNETNRPFSEGTRKKLEEIRDLTIKADSQVDQSKLPETSIPRQHEIIRRSLAFLKESLSAGQVSSNTLQQFTRAIAKLTLQNVDEAVAAALKKMDEIITSWRQEMSPAEWDKTHIIVAAGHMPHQQNSSMQYFQKLLKEKQEGQRIIYYEGVYDEKLALDLLVTHILDRRIAIDFYKDPWRMHRDLLADGAHKYLQKHPPKEHN